MVDDLLSPGRFTHYNIIPIIFRPGRRTTFYVYDDKFLLTMMTDIIIFGRRFKRRRRMNETSGIGPSHDECHPTMSMLRFTRHDDERLVPYGPPIQPSTTDVIIRTIRTANCFTCGLYNLNNRSRFRAAIGTPYRRWRWEVRQKFSIL